MGFSRVSVTDLPEIDTSDTGARLKPGNKTWNASPAGTRPSSSRESNVSVSVLPFTCAPVLL